PCGNWPRSFEWLSSAHPGTNHSAGGNGGNLLSEHSILRIAQPTVVAQIQKPAPVKRVVVRREENPKTDLPPRERPPTSRMGTAGPESSAFVVQFALIAEGSDRRP